MNILVIGQKFTTYAPLNFFVSGPISKIQLSAESLDQKGHVTKYSPLPGFLALIELLLQISIFAVAVIKGSVFNKVMAGCQMPMNVNLAACSTTPLVLSRVMIGIGLGWVKSGLFSPPH